MVLLACLAFLGDAILSNTGQATPPAIAVSSESQETRYPFAFCDAQGTRMVIPRAPQRLISLAPNLTETLYALGCGDRLLGNTRYCNYPPEAQQLPKIGGPQDPHIERLLEIQPDLILATRLTPPEAVRQMRALGLTVAVWDPKEIALILSEMDLLGKVLNISREAQSLVQDIQQRIDKVRNRLSHHKRPKTLLLYGTQPLFSTGKRTFAGQILEISGASNIAASLDTDWPQISREKVFSEDPEVILIASSISSRERISPTLALWKNDSFWRHVAAVKAGRVYEVPDSLLSIPGPRMAEAAERVAELLEGAVAIPSPTP